MKLSDLVVIALDNEIGVLSSNPYRGNYGNCPNIVSFLQKLFFMHKQSLSQRQTRRVHTAILSANHSHHSIAAELFNICPFKMR